MSSSNKKCFEANEHANFFLSSVFFGLNISIQLKWETREWRIFAEIVRPLSVTVGGQTRMSQSDLGFA